MNWNSVDGSVEDPQNFFYSKQSHKLLSISILKGLSHLANGTLAFVAFTDVPCLGMRSPRLIKKVSGG